MKSIVNKFSCALLGAASLASVGLYAGDAGATWRNCSQVVGVYYVQAAEPHIEVACASPYTGAITYAGYRTTVVNSAADAERFLSLALAAYMSGKRFRVDMGTTGCSGATANCMYVTSFGAID